MTIPRSRSVIMAAMGGMMAIATASAQPTNQPDYVAPGRPGLLGMQMPGPQATAAIDAMLAALDRSPNLVVAEIGSRVVTWGDVADSVRGMPPITRSVPPRQLYQTAAIHVMQNKALAYLGETTGLDKNPIVQRHMKNAADEILANEYLNRTLIQNITDKALRAVYDRDVANKPGPDEVHLRIVMTATEAEASYLIQKLQAGADFVQIAREFSRDGTAANGGDLGYVPLIKLAPEIGAVAFALAPGQTTAFPVKSGNYWFIIRVDGRIHKPGPTFEEAQSTLADDLVHATIGPLKAMAIRQVPVKIHDVPGGTPGLPDGVKLDAPGTPAPAPR